MNSDPTDQSYSDLYDHMTVEECRRLEDYFTKQEVSKEHAEASKYLHHIALWALKGERYAKKEETLKRWMSRDRTREAALRNAAPPSPINCLVCGDSMGVFDKSLWPVGDKDRIQFFFRCRGCQAMRVFFDNGEEYRPARQTCKACGGSAQAVHSRSGDTITTTVSCQSCPHIATETLDLQSQQPVIDKDFIKDRDRFCLSAEDGGNYLTLVANIRTLTEKERAKEENRDLHEAVAKLQKLTVTEMGQLLTSALEKHNFGKLTLQNPESTKHSLWIAFSVQDLSNRREYDSTKALKDALAGALQMTNWRLGSDGLQYSLGVLTGRLRGIDGEDSLLELVRMRAKKAQRVTDGEVPQDG